MKRFLRRVAILSNILVLLSTQQIAAVTKSDVSCANAGGIGGTCHFKPCSNGGTATPAAEQTDSNSKPVYILGDSITHKAESEYLQAFEHKGTATIDSSDKRSLSAAGDTGNKLSGMDAIDHDTDKIQGASAIVVALGTNGGDSDKSIASAIKAIKKANDTAPIYWVDTISVGRKDGYNKNVLGPVNRAIYSQSSSLGYKVISWFKAVDQTGDPKHPDGSEKDPNGYIVQANEFVHPTPKGSKALAKLVASAVSSNSNGADSLSSLNAAANAATLVSCCAANGSAVDASPPDNSSSDQPANPSSDTGSLQMEKVDLSGFHPDPQAVNYFKHSALPLMKKYIPFYAKAAQAEGIPQNWELLPGLHGPELNFGNYYKSNGVANSPAGSAGGPSGPFQETAYEMRTYLKDPDYGPVLKTLVTPQGTTIPHNKLTGDQFVVLARIAIKHWFTSALGSDFDKLKKGPIPFDPSTNTNTIMGRIMGRWNSGNFAEVYNGFNTSSASYNPGAAVNPGMATTYYLLKQAEADGTLNVSLVGGDNNSCGSQNNSSTSPDCASASGNAKILCEAKPYAGIYYRWGGGHQGFKAFTDGCPDPSNPPNNKPSGAPGGGHGGNPSPCATDCSGLVSIAVDKAFNQKFMWSVPTLQSDSTNWKEVDKGQAQPGDVVTKGSAHIEIVDHVDGNKLVTFGSHSTGTKTGQRNGTLSYYDAAYRYIGPGSSQ